MTTKWDYFEETTFDELFAELVTTDTFFAVWRERKTTDFINTGRFIIYRDDYSFFNVFDIASGNGVAFQFNNGFHITDAYITVNGNEVDDFLRYLGNELADFIAIEEGDTNE